jgi:hypothetical protein
MHSDEDFRTVYNPGAKTTQGIYAQQDPAAKNATQTLAAINPAHPTGLEPPPKDWQYEVPHQLKKPLN